MKNTTEIQRNIKLVRLSNDEEIKFNAYRPEQMTHIFAPNPYVAATAFTHEFLDSLP